MSGSTPRHDVQKSNSLTSPFAWHLSDVGWASLQKRTEDVDVDVDVKSWDLLPEPADCMFFRDVVINQACDV